jgi:hypothetical protein
VEATFALPYFCHDPRNGGFGFRLGGAELFQLGFQVVLGNVDRQHFQNIGATSATAFSSLMRASGRCDSTARM